jgi:glycine hydroxymethyltransferase
MRTACGKPWGRSLSVSPFRVLFVCTGNQCRSPVAQGILEALLRKQNRSGIEPDSAGTHAAQPLPPLEEAVELAGEHGVDIAHIRSKACTAELVNRADLVLVMGHLHRAVIAAAVPPARDKTFLLKTFGRNVNDYDYETEIGDPTGGEPEDYRFCYAELEGEVNRILPLLIDRAARKHE